MWSIEAVFIIVQTAKGNTGRSALCQIPPLPAAGHRSQRSEHSTVPLKMVLCFLLFPARWRGQQWQSWSSLRFSFDPVNRLICSFNNTGSLYLSWGVLLGLGLHHRCPGGEQLLLWEMGLSCSGWKWRIWSKLSWLLMIGHYSNARSVFSWQFSFTCHSYFSPAPPLAAPNPKPQFPDNPPNSSWTAFVSLHRVLSLLCQ